MTTLLHERGTLGFALSGVLESQVKRLTDLAKSKNGHDAIVRDRIAEEWIVQQALKMTNYRSLTSADADRASPAPRAPPSSSRGRRRTSA